LIFKGLISIVGFAGLAILVGLISGNYPAFYLSSFLTQTRTKEIGIRKISGASPYTIVAMFAKEFSVWVVLANIIATPVVIFFLGKWLRSFPYKTDIHSWIFILGLVISLAVALLTVSLRVLQAASANPAEAVRYS
jgi:putative ABC transport system permease protein